jgi:citronellol/citronellal dehydrogenase
MNKVALITGATRGIGRAMALGLSRNGYNVVIAGKSVNDNPNLPGTIYSVAKEVEDIGTQALPVKVDLRDEKQIENLVNETKNRFGRLDVLINNAGALFWKPIKDTEIKNYDLINNINSRATFYLSKLCIPLMQQSGGGHIIIKSPPLLESNLLSDSLSGKTAYMISKLGMTLTSLGISEEYKGTGIACNTLWPSTMIESYATINNKLGTPDMWRNTDIIMDSVLEIINEDSNNFTGNQLIDEMYLRSKGVTDFSKYQCISGSEPPKLTELPIQDWKSKL